MKKGWLSFVLVVAFFFSLSFVSNASALLPGCKPVVELVNQDPYPANPNEYVRVVFQISGIDNPNCKKVSFELKDSFPFSLDPGETRTYEFSGDNYVRNYNSDAIVPYKLRVHPDAIDGDNEIEAILEYTDESGGVITQIEQFDINVAGVKVDFEIHVKDFESSTNTITFEILNVGDGDIEALVVEVPKQDNIVIKGANREIIGDLDSNEDTTFKYEALPSDGEISLAISYTDGIDVRRQMMKNVYYDSSYFTDRKVSEVQPKSTYYYLFWLLVLVWIVLGVRGWWKKRKKKAEERKGRK